MFLVVYKARNRLSDKISKLIEDRLDTESALANEDVARYYWKIQEYMTRYKRFTEYLIFRGLEMYRDKRPELGIRISKAGL